MSDAKDTAKDAAGGIIEDLKGKAKEVVGSVTGRDDLVREGKAQQDKAASLREAATKEAEAEKARAQAKVHEAREQAEQ